MLKDGEHIEPLGGLGVIVSNENRFSTDTILLADFSKPKKHETAIELGAGCGAVSLLWCRGERPRSVTSVEIQPECADMLSRSVEYNNLQNVIHVVQGDLRDLSGKARYGSFDVAAVNPPYKVKGTGLLNADERKSTARHELMCTLDDITAAAARLLRFGGRFCICQRPERLCDVLMSMRQADLEPKRLRMVQQRNGKAPKLFLAEGRRGGKRGGLVTLPALIIESAECTAKDGGAIEFSQEMLDIYGDYKQSAVSG